MRVVIVGGGIIGLSTAYRLGRAGVQVVLLERGTLGSGATLASLGALWPSRPSILGPLQRMQRQSLWMLEGFLQEVSAAGGVEIPFARQGHIEILTSEKAAGDAKRDAGLAGEWPRFSDDPPLAYIPPGERLPISAEVSSGEFGAFRSTVTAQVEVNGLVAALAAACRAVGVRLCEHAGVSRLRVEGGRVVRVETSVDLPAFDHVLLATGAWTHQLVPQVGTRPVKGQAVEVEAVVDVPQLILKRDKTYLVPWGRRVLIGSTTEKDAGFDTTPREDAAERLVASARALLPALEGARLVRTWAGVRPDATKHRPVMGRVPGVENLFVSAGHYKTGIGLSALVSEAMSALMRGVEGSVDLSPFAVRG